MTILQVTLLTLYALGMAIGQLLFKYAAEQIATIPGGSAPDFLVRLLKLAFDPFFVLAIGLYMLISVLWVWILSFTPLSRAYPFGALAFIFTVVIGVLFFREMVTRTYLLGLGFILVGILIISRS
jgi:drug/metabolite transporter (DMT)-like permease